MKFFLANPNQVNVQMGYGKIDSTHVVFNIYIYMDFVTSY